MTRRSAPIAAVEMAAERCGATGHNGPPDLGTAARQRAGGKIGRTEGAQHLGQADWIHRSRSAGGEQFQRRDRTGQAGLRQMEVTHGGPHVTVTEQALNGMDVYA